MWNERILPALEDIRDVLENKGAYRCKKKTGLFERPVWK
jgi:hypothetical protein